MRTRFAWLLLLLPVLVAAAAAPASGVALTCNPSGSWVAGTAAANEFFQRLNPTQTTISVERGALSATFDHGHLTYGSLSLTLAGTLGATRIKEVVDLETEAPYHVRGARLVLGAGTYSLHYVSVTLYPRGGGTAHPRLPDQHIATPPTSVAISCTRSTLRWTVPVPHRAGVPLTFHRDRG